MGAIGRAVCRELAARGHRVRAVDRVPTTGVSDALVLDLADPDAARKACEGVDTVIHLAAQAAPRSDFLTDLLPNNIVTTHNVFEQASQAGVERVVFASSMHVGHRTPPDRPIHADDSFAPENHYGATKVFGEAMGHVYASRGRMSVISVRIGFLPRGEEYAQKLAANNNHNMYISPGDSGRFFAQCVEASLPASHKYVVLFAYGAGGEKDVDLETARQLIGYEPRDRWPTGMNEIVPGFEERLKS